MVFGPDVAVHGRKERVPQFRPDPGVPGGVRKGVGNEIGRKPGAARIGYPQSEVIESLRLGGGAGGVGAVDDLIGNPHHRVEACDAALHPPGKKGCGKGERGGIGPDDSRSRTVGGPGVSLGGRQQVERPAARKGQCHSGRVIHVVRRSAQLAPACGSVCCAAFASACSRRSTSAATASTVASSPGLPAMCRQAGAPLA